MSGPTTTTQPPLNFRPPPALSSAKSADTAPSSFSKPSSSWLSGTWHVTHSTLPMWKSNRNVRITYTPLKTESGSNAPTPSESTTATQHTIDDLVEYQPLGSDKWKTINGIDKLDTSDIHEATYNWRGKGWLKIASSRWSVIGWGEEEGGWAVTFFEKTLFTPAGVDIYARQKGGLSEDLVKRIKEEMRRIERTDDAVGDFAKHADGLFDVKHDWE